MKQPVFDSPPPCIQAPRLWDAPTQQEARTGEYRERHLEAIDMCRNQCPKSSFEQCRIFALTEGLADDSILAGMTGAEREQKTGRRRPRGGIKIEVLFNRCVNGHHPKNRYRNPTTERLRCRLCDRQSDLRRREQSCRRKHPLSEVYISTAGDRRCHACERIQHEKQAAKRKNKVPTTVGKMVAAS